MIQLALNLFYRGGSNWFISKENYNFQAPGSNFFHGGVQLLIPKETDRTCDFPGAANPL